MVHLDEVWVDDSCCDWQMAHNMKAAACCYNCEHSYDHSVELYCRCKLMTEHKNAKFSDRNEYVNMYVGSLICDEYFPKKGMNDE
ncbi:MAG: hypothetical protein WC479_10230 [Candidatus Izemoplasmatales bacterium]